MGIIVSSSNWDRFARNPNNGDTFYTDAEASVTVTNTLLWDGTSALVLPTQ